MVCTALTISEAPTLSASDVGFGIFGDYLDTDCIVPIADLTGKLMHIVAMVTANMNCTAKVTLSWKLDGVPDTIDWDIRFDAGTVKATFDSDRYYVVGVYTVPAITFSNIR